MNIQKKIIAAARCYIGTPFKHQGRVPGMALDCVGLAVCVLDALGIAYEDRQGYSRLPHQGRLQAALDSQPCLVRVDRAEPGDMLLMRFKSEPMHVAICAGPTIIHAYEPSGKVCEHRIDDVWRARIVQAYRVQERA